MGRNERAEDEPGAQVPNRSQEERFSYGFSLFHSLAGDERKGYDGDRNSGYSRLRENR